MSASISASDVTVKAHPWPVRVTHWLNVLAVMVMVGSGWRIYDNVPIFKWLTFPIWMTLGGDPDLSYKTSGDVGFGNALLWHFAGMWLLACNGLVLPEPMVFCLRSPAPQTAAHPRQKSWSMMSVESLHSAPAACRI